MDVTPLIKKGAQVIQSYAGGNFKISAQVYQSAVIVTAEETRVWDVPAFADLTAAHFEGIDAEVVLLGTGKSFQFLPPALKKALKEKGLSVDSMDTGAACRTFNVLMAEGRRVVAVLLPA